MRTIPYGRQSINDDDIAAVAEVLQSDWLTTGPAVAAFEEAISAVAGTPSAVAVSNGTAALHCAYEAAGVRAGGEVVVPALTFAATATAAMHCGAKVIFADIESDTGNIDPVSVESLISSATQVIAGVDYAGHPVEADILSTLARKAGALFVEDAAHSIGSTWNGRPVGSLADLTTFSFFPTKNLTTGEGGAVVGHDVDLLESARKFRGHGLIRDPESLKEPDVGPWHQEIHRLSLNYRLPDILCALGLSQIRRIEQFKARRATVFAKYSEGLIDLEDVVLPSVRPGADPMWHLYPVRVPADRRREIFEALRADGVLVQVNYMPVYWHPLFADLGYKRGMCPNAELYYSQEISLPMHAELTASEVDFVIDSVRKAVR